MLHAMELAVIAGLLVAQPATERRINARFEIPVLEDNELGATSGYLYQRRSGQLWGRFPNSHVRFPKISHGTIVPVGGSIYKVEQITNTNVELIQVENAARLLDVKFEDGMELMPIGGFVELGAERHWKIQFERTEMRGESSVVIVSGFGAARDVSGVYRQFDTLKTDGVSYRVAFIAVARDGFGGAVILDRAVMSERCGPRSGMSYTPFRERIELYTLPEVHYKGRQQIDIGHDRERVLQYWTSSVGRIVAFERGVFFVAQYTDGCVNLRRVGDAELPDACVPTHGSIFLPFGFPTILNGQLVFLFNDADRVVKTRRIDVARESIAKLKVGDDIMVDKAEFRIHRIVPRDEERKIEGWLELTARYTKSK